MQDRYGYDPAGQTRSHGLRRLSRLTWRAAQLGTMATVGFAVVFARTAPAATVSGHPTAKATATSSASPSPSPSPSPRPSAYTVTIVTTSPPPRPLARRPPYPRNPSHRRPLPRRRRPAPPRARCRPPRAPATGEADATRHDSTGRRTGRAFGTFATLLTTEAAALEQAHVLLTAELLAMDAACSRFRRDAELWRVNHARGRPVRVSPLLGEALTVALAAARLTDGDVDPTCGTCLVRLGYDRDFARARRHTSTLRQPAAPAPGWRSVEFDPALS